MAIRSGTVMVMKYDSAVVGAARSFSLSLTRNMIDVSSKDSSFRKIAPGKIGGSFSAEFVTDWADVDQEKMLDNILARTAVAVAFGKETPTTGDKVFSGSAHLQSVELDAPDNEASSLSVSGKFNGTITVTTT
jgi:hypothetical protein